MKRRLLVVGAALALVASAGFAQKWEVGGVGGGGFYRNVAVTNPAGSAITGFQSGPAYGGVIGQNLYRYVSGELRYTYRVNNMKLTGNGGAAGFDALSHVVHYDFLLHAAPVGAKVRPFAAIGTGVKIFRGTGKESAYQPLSGFALLTKTQEWKPLVSAGAGTKFAVSSHVIFRVEFRDYITPFPKQVIAPAPGAKIGGLLHDYVPMVGITFTF